MTLPPDVVWNPDPVYELGNEWISFGDAFAAQLQAMTGAVSGLEAGWTGSSSQDMAAAWEQVEKVVTDAIENCYHMGEQINYYAMLRSAQEATVAADAHNAAIDSLIGALALFIPMLIPGLGELLDQLGPLIDALSDLTMVAQITGPIGSALENIMSTVSGFIDGVFATAPEINGATLGENIVGVASGAAKLVGGVYGFNIATTAIEDAATGQPFDWNSVKDPFPTSAADLPDFFASVAAGGVLGELGEGVFPKGVEDTGATGVGGSVVPLEGPEPVLGAVGGDLSPQVPTAAFADPDLGSLKAPGALEEPPVPAPVLGDGPNPVIGGSVVDPPGTGPVAGAHGPAAPEDLGPATSFDSGTGGGVPGGDGPGPGPVGVTGSALGPADAAHDAAAGGGLGLGPALDKGVGDPLASGAGPSVKPAEDAADTLSATSASTAEASGPSSSAETAPWDVPSARSRGFDKQAEVFRQAKLEEGFDDGQIDAAIRDARQSYAQAAQDLANGPGSRSWLLSKNGAAAQLFASIGERMQLALDKNTTLGNIDVLAGKASGELGIDPAGSGPEATGFDSLVGGFKQAVNDHFGVGLASLADRRPDPDRGYLPKTAADLKGAFDAHLAKLGAEHDLAPGLLEAGRDLGHGVLKSIHADYDRPRSPSSGHTGLAEPTDAKKAEALAAQQLADLHVQAAEWRSNLMKDLQSLHDGAEQAAKPEADSAPETSKDPLSGEEYQHPYSFGRLKAEATLDELVEKATTSGAKVSGEEVDAMLLAVGRFALRHSRNVADGFGGKVEPGTADDVRKALAELSEHMATTLPALSHILRDTGDAARDVLEAAREAGLDDPGKVDQFVAKQAGELFANHAVSVIDAALDRAARGHFSPEAWLDAVNDASRTADAFAANLDAAVKGRTALAGQVRWARAEFTDAVDETFDDRSGAPLLSLMHLGDKYTADWVQRYDKVYGQGGLDGKAYLKAKDAWDKSHAPAPIGLLTHIPDADGGVMHGPDENPTADVVAPREFRPANLDNPSGSDEETGKDSAPFTFGAKVSKQSAMDDPVSASAETVAEPDDEIYGLDPYGVRALRPTPGLLAEIGPTSVDAAKAASFLKKLNLTERAPLPHAPLDLTTLDPGPVSEDGVPKLVHSIWFGGPLHRDGGSREQFMANIAAAADAFPDHSFVVWTDVSRHDFATAELHGTEADMLSWADEHGIVLANIDEVFNAEAPMSVLHSAFHTELARGNKNDWASASDLARIEILYRFGGLYNDGDNPINVSAELNLLRPADPALFAQKGLAVGWQGARDSGKPSNSLLLARPGSSLLHSYLELVHARYSKPFGQLVADKSGYTAEESATYSDVLKQMAQENDSSGELVPGTPEFEVVYRTGPNTQLYSELMDPGKAPNAYYDSEAYTAVPKLAHQDDVVTIEFGNSWKGRAPDPDLPDATEAQITAAVESAVISLHRDFAGRQGGVYLPAAARPIGRLPKQNRAEAWAQALGRFHHDLSTSEKSAEWVSGHELQLPGNVEPLVDLLFPDTPKVNFPAPDPSLGLPASGDPGITSITLENGNGRFGRAWVDKADQTKLSEHIANFDAANDWYFHVQPGEDGFTKVGRSAVPWDPRAGTYVAAVHGAPGGKIVLDVLGNKKTVSGGSFARNVLARRRSVIGLPQETQYILASCEAALPEGDSGIAPAQHLADERNAVVYAPTTDVVPLGDGSGNFALTPGPRGEPGQWHKFVPKGPVEALSQPVLGLEGGEETGKSRVTAPSITFMHQEPGEAGAGDETVPVVAPGGVVEQQTAVAHGPFYFSGGALGEFELSHTPTWTPETKSADLVALRNALTGDLREDLPPTVHPTPETAAAVHAKLSEIVASTETSAWTRLLRSGAQFESGGKLIRIDVDLIASQAPQAIVRPPGAERHEASAVSAEEKAKSVTKSVSFDPAGTLVKAGLNLAAGAATKGMLKFDFQTVKSSAEKVVSGKKAARKNTSDDSALLNAHLAVQISVDGRELFRPEGRPILRTGLAVEVPLAYSSTATLGEYPDSPLTRSADGGGPGLDDPAVRQADSQVLLAALSTKPLINGLQRQMLDAGYSRDTVAEVTKQAQKTFLDEKWLVENGRRLLTNGALSDLLRAGGFAGRFQIQARFAGLQRKGRFGPMPLQDAFGQSNGGGRENGMESSFKVAGGPSTSNIHGAPSPIGNVGVTLTASSSRALTGSFEKSTSIETAVLRETSQTRYAAEFDLVVTPLIDKGRPMGPSFVVRSTGEVDVPDDDVAVFEAAASGDTVVTEPQLAPEAGNPGQGAHGRPAAVYEPAPHEPAPLTRRQGQGFGKLLSLPGSEHLAQQLYEYLRPQVETRRPGGSKVWGSSGINRLRAGLAALFSTPALESDLNPLLAGIRYHDVIDTVPVDVLVTGQLLDHLGSVPRPLSVESKVSESVGQGSGRAKVKRLDLTVSGGIEVTGTAPSSFNMNGASAGLGGKVSDRFGHLASVSSSRGAKAEGDGFVHKYRMAYRVDLRFGGSGKPTTTLWLADSAAPAEGGVPRLRAHIAVPPQYGPDGELPKPAEVSGPGVPIDFGGSAEGVLPSFQVMPDLTDAVARAYRHLNGLPEADDSWDLPSELVHALDPTGLQASFGDQIGPGGAYIPLPHRNGWNQWMTVRTEVRGAWVAKNHLPAEEGGTGAVNQYAGFTAYSETVHGQGKSLAWNGGINPGYEAKWSSAVAGQSIEFKANVGIGGGQEYGRDHSSKRTNTEGQEAAYAGQSWTVRATPRFTVSVFRSKGASVEHIDVAPYELPDGIDLLTAGHRGREFGMSQMPPAPDDLAGPRREIDPRLSSRYASFPEKLNAHDVAEGIVQLIRAERASLGELVELRRFIGHRFSDVSLRAHLRDLFGTGMFAFHPLTDAFATRPRILWVRLTATRGETPTYLGPRPVELGRKIEKAAGTGTYESVASSFHAGVNPTLSGPTGETAGLNGGLNLQYEYSHGRVRIEENEDSEGWEYETEDGGSVAFSRGVTFHVQFGVTTEMPEPVRLISTGFKKVAFPLSDLVVQIRPRHLPFQDVWYRNRPGAVLGGGPVPAPDSTLTYLVPKYLTVPDVARDPVPVTDEVPVATAPAGHAAEFGTPSWTPRGGPAADEDESVMLSAQDTEHLAGKLMPLGLPAAGPIAGWTPALTLKPGRNQRLADAVARASRGEAPVPPAVPELQLSVNSGYRLSRETLESELLANLPALLRNAHRISVRGRTVTVGLEVLGADRLTIAEIKGRGFKGSVEVGGEDKGATHGWGLDGTFNGGRLSDPTDSGTSAGGHHASAGKNGTVVEIQSEETGPAPETTEFAIYAMKVRVTLDGPYGRLRFTVDRGLYGQLPAADAADFELRASAVFHPVSLQDDPVILALTEKSRLDSRAVDGREEDRRSAQTRLNELVELDESIAEHDEAITALAHWIDRRGAELAQDEAAIEGLTDTVTALREPHAAAVRAYEEATDSLARVQRNTRPLAKAHKRFTKLAEKGSRAAVKHLSGISEQFAGNEQAYASAREALARARADLDDAVHALEKAEHQLAQMKQRIADTLKELGELHQDLARETAQGEEARRQLIAALAEQGGSREARAAALQAAEAALESARRIAAASAAELARHRHRRAGLASARAAGHPLAPVAETEGGTGTAPATAFFGPAPVPTLVSASASRQYLARLD